MIQHGLYYGPPDKDQFCSYAYVVAGRFRSDLRCPSHVEFHVKVPDGRGDDWRKAWAACTEHLHVVIWQMQDAHGGKEFYTGDYLLRAFVPEDGEDGRTKRVPERVRDVGTEPEAQVPGA